MLTVTMSRFSATIWLKREGLLIASRGLRTCRGLGWRRRAISGPDPLPISAAWTILVRRHGSLACMSTDARTPGWRHETSNPINLEGGRSHDAPARDAHRPARRSGTSSAARARRSVPGHSARVEPRHFFLGQDRAQDEQGEAPAEDERRGFTRSSASWRTRPAADAACLHDSGEPAERLRDRPQPEHSAVAVTHGITQLLSESELRGVIAHELAHIRNRDMLTRPSPLRSAARSPGSRHAAVHGRRRRQPARVRRPLAMASSRRSRRRSSSSLSRASASTRPTPLAPASRAARTPWPTRSSACEAGAKAMPDAGHLGRGAALHRQALPRRRHRGALLDPPPY